jgi:hypothetical protein
MCCRACAPGWIVNPMTHAPAPMTSIMTPHAMITVYGRIFHAECQAHERQLRLIGSVRKLSAFRHSAKTRQIGSLRSLIPRVQAVAQCPATP